MKKLMHILVPILLSIAILVSIGWYLFVYDRDFTRDTLLGQARYHDLHGNSRLSAWFYDMAFEYSGRSENVAIELASQYQADGNFTKAEYTLTNAINAGPTAELYTALCKTYVAQDKLLDAVNLLANIADPGIRAELAAKRPPAPTADQEAGFYNQYISVGFQVPEGKVYFTTDGEYPTTANAPYSSPIVLPAGETVIHAITVASNGLVSPVNILSYTINGVVEPAIFVDDEMEKAMRAAIGAASDDLIYTDDLWTITDFTVPSGVANFGDLSLMPFLETLTIQDQKMDSLSSLSGLNSLRTLTLNGCRFPVDELSLLADLPSLTNLTLSGCSLSTIEGLAELTGLTHLDLSDNTIRKLEPISGMTGLVELNLQHNAVTNLSALSGLTNLDSLDVSFNALSTLSPLASCVKLTRLAADNNRIDALNGIDKLTLLNFLSVEYNQLTDISLLAACKELENLSFANNQVSDISALGGLTKLDILDFAYNKVNNLPKWQDGCTLRVIDGSYNALRSLDTLAKLEKISYVYMDYNALTNVNALANCYNLVQVNVYGNEIKDVSALTEHDIIVNYDPT